MWITREKLWINRMNWGKLAILFENSYFTDPHIWGLRRQAAQIFSAAVGWGKSSFLYLHNPQCAQEKFTRQLPLYLPQNRNSAPYIGKSDPLIAGSPHIHSPYYDYD